MKKKARLFGQEYLDANDKLFARLPKKYHAAVKDLVNKIQLWDMWVFLSVSVERVKREDSNAK